MTTNQEEMNTFEGQVYRDEMMDCEVQVTIVDEIGVFVRNTTLIEEEGDSGGSPYIWPAWAQALDSGRFKLVEDVDSDVKDDDEPQDEEEGTEGGTEPDESEEPEEEPEASEKELSPNDFEHQDALSW